MGCRTMQDDMGGGGHRFSEELSSSDARREMLNNCDQSIASMTRLDQSLKDR